MEAVDLLCSRNAWPQNGPLHPTQREAIAADRLELCLDDASALLYPDNIFHKIFATNVVYFWKDPLANLQELRRVMKPGGRLALYVIAKDDLLKFKVTQTGVYQLYAGKDLVGLLTKQDFTRYDSSPNPNVTAPAPSRWARSNPALISSSNRAPVGGQAPADERPPILISTLKSLML